MNIEVKSKAVEETKSFDFPVLATWKPYKGIIVMITNMDRGVVIKRADQDADLGTQYKTGEVMSHIDYKEPNWKELPKDTQVILSN